MNNTNQTAEAIEKALVQQSGLHEFFQATFTPPGIYFGIPIFIMLILASIIIVERVYMILFIYSANASSLMHRVQRLIMENNIEEAIKICSKKKNAAVYEVFKVALVNADRPIEEIQDHIEVAKLGIVPKLQQRMPYLFTIANVATLMGLLGTIVGLIFTFDNLKGIENAQEKQDLLSGGISLALGTTAFGLIVAIPSMLCYGYLFNRINHMLDEIEHFSGKLLILLRTGSRYFDQFSTEAMVSTEQNPKSLMGKDITAEIEARSKSQPQSSKKYDPEPDSDTKSSENTAFLTNTELKKKKKKRENSDAA